LKSLPPSVGDPWGITLRVLSHNRLNFLEKTLDSAFFQTEPFERVELFDNGSTFSTKALAGRYPALRLRASPRVVPGHENMRRALVETPDTPWLCVFHDDDILHADFVKTIRAALRADPGLGAVSANGEVIDEQGETHGALLPNLKTDLLLRGPADLARWYCEGFIPFPATVYRWSSEFGSDLDFASPYGRCGDVALLARVVQRAPILLLTPKLFSYRRHPEQDSAGFLWWEETKRWDLQRQLCRDDSRARRYVEEKRKDRLTSRWLNAWLRGETREEPWSWDFFSPASVHRFVRNNKLAILRRIFRVRELA